MMPKIEIGTLLDRARELDQSSEDCLSNATGSVRDTLSGLADLVEQMQAALEKPFETQLVDLDRKPIRLGDKVRVFEYDGAIWEAVVIFEQGVVTVDTETVELVANPTRWDQPHPWTRSRSFACEVGIGEWEGVARKPLSGMGFLKKEDQPPRSFTGPWICICRIVKEGGPR